VFQGETNLADYVRKEVRRRFPKFSTGISNAFIFLPVDCGDGLGVLNPFVRLAQLDGRLLANPETVINTFLVAEAEAYRKAKTFHDARLFPRPTNSNLKPAKQRFLSFLEYTRTREQTSHELLKAYNALLHRPERLKAKLSGEVEAMLDDYRGL
ncbi:MAG: hypothetical protein Q9224_005693, partial [Gallowayella concinna]